MYLQEKAKNYIERFELLLNHDGRYWKSESVECAIACVENEYHSLREQLFNLRACGVIENEKVYLSRIQGLIDEEKLLKDVLNCSKLP